MGYALAVVQPLPTGYVFDPADPRAPAVDQWERMLADERARVVAMLPAAVPLAVELAGKLAEEQRLRAEEQRLRAEEQRLRAEEQRLHAEELATKLAEEQRLREDAVRQLAEARAEIERLRKSAT
jgi:hypothetical protein